MAKAQIDLMGVGGGSNVYCDTNLSLGTGDNPINCGFEPKYILFVFNQQNYSGNGYVYEYDKDVSTSNFAYTSDNKTWSTNGPIGTGISGWGATIGSVGANGFSIYNAGTAGNLIVHSVIAIG